MQQPQVERLELDQLTCWRVRTAEAELLLAQQGAQILSYQRDGEQPLIWLSPQAAYRRGQGVRGGVPICWPWFGDLRRNPPAVQQQYSGGTLVPFHGLVRDLDWQLLGIDSQDGAVSLAFAFDTRTQPLAGWPHAAELRLNIRLDQQLHLARDSHNLGTEPLAISQALHSYFAVSDIRQVRVTGLDGCPYVDTLQDWQRLRQQGELTFAGETDRLYLETPARLDILDPAWQRRIRLHSGGTRSAVLWNPWIDKSQRLTQFASDAWQGMLCIEHANVLEDVRVLAPGARHRLELSLDSLPL
jgi:glucose-6-phosphate 1-epimerase